MSRHHHHHPAMRTRPAKLVTVIPSIIKHITGTGGRSLILIERYTHTEIAFQDRASFPECGATLFIAGPSKACVNHAERLIRFLGANSKSRRAHVLKLIAEDLAHGGSFSTPVREMQELLKLLHVSI